MSVATLDQRHWQHRLADLARRYAVPGSVLGIAYGDQTVTAVHGVTNVHTGVEVTTDTLFQIGSITKVLTASLVMTLVDEGTLDLDEPVMTYLPELRLSDAEATARITMRHLLTHTSGIAGDFFHDTGRGDDCVERYVSALAGLPMTHPPAATWSYSNGGFVVAGRVIEKLTGRCWDDAMRQRLLGPAGLADTVTLPEDALLRRAAVGHVHMGDEDPRPTEVWLMPRSIGPAGATMCSTARDLLTFARLQSARGLAVDGTPLLTADSVASMHQEQAKLPDPHSKTPSIGIAWFLDDWNGRRVIGHDGGTIGQSAFLRCLPDLELAVVLLTNGGRTLELDDTITREVFREVAGLDMPPKLTPPAQPADVDVAPHVGTYQRSGARVEIMNGAPGPRLRLTDTQQVPGLAHEPVELDLVPVTDDLFVVRIPGMDAWAPVTFYSLPDGTPYLHFGIRATPRVA
ncbi:serine hydrolase domain-containing protein [Phytoactinopolyspora limicola]|uniref:serine hydrolase domain-containing protein n=1 Tax=Phytoactinopolyspora limicola TaxID=2715536 RepID=UPI00140B1BEF|nr:serine hydrolase domain-containing protein [Phytoactinopolyspora limicola]